MDRQQLFVRSSAAFVLQILTLGLLLAMLLMRDASLDLDWQIDARNDPLDTPAPNAVHITAAIASTLASVPRTRNDTLADAVCVVIAVALVLVTRRLAATARRAGAAALVSVADYMWLSWLFVTAALIWVCLAPDDGCNTHRAYADSVTTRSRVRILAAALAPATVMPALAAWYVVSASTTS